MASLKEIRGIDIEVRTSDPENPESGQVWYNTTTELLKGYKQVVGNAWSTGGDLNTARTFQVLQETEHNLQLYILVELLQVQLILQLQNLMTVQVGQKLMI